jgi:hypothetical protein
VAGTITITPANTGTPLNLLALIQAQLDTNFMSYNYLSIAADTSAQIYGGVANKVGALSATNYGWTLTSSSSPKVYTSVYPGANVPLGSIWIFTATNGSNVTFHIEGY